MSTCVGPECGRPVAVKRYSLCSGHYSQQWRGVELRPLIRHSPRNATVAQLLEARAVRCPETGCLRWQGTHDSDGYGKVKREGANRRVHQVVWTDSNGPVPEGMVIDHTCHTRDCVNIDHLRLLSNEYNLQNRSGAQSNSKTGVRNVHLSPNGRFRVCVKRLGKVYHGGTFDTIEDAEAKAVEMRMELFTHTDGR